MLARIFLGSGTFKPEVRAALESEGVVVLEEGLSGSVRYRHFRAPGKRFHGKVVAMRMALAVTERRLVAYSSSGRNKLMDSPFDDPRLDALTVTAEGDRLDFHVDYARMGEPKVSGEVTIRARTPAAARIAEHVSSRVAARSVIRSE